MVRGAGKGRGYQEMGHKSLHGLLCGCANAGKHHAPGGLAGACLLCGRMPQAAAARVQQGAHAVMYAGGGAELLLGLWDVLLVTRTACRGVLCLWLTSLKDGHRPGHPSCCTARASCWTRLSGILVDTYTLTPCTTTG
jgi:hypothetical protein